MKKFLIVAALMLLSSAVAKAVPAYPVKRTLTNKNGETITLTLRGDEHFSFYTDETSRPYLRKLGDYVPVTMDDISKVWSERLVKANARRVSKLRTRGLGETNGIIKGNKKGLVILMEFQDQKFAISNPKATYQDFFNKEGYSDYGMAGSVKDYFKAQSYGNLVIDFDVAGPYTASQKEAYYGAHDDNANDKNPGALMKEACQVADEAVNFADYDWDGDGEVDQVFVIYAGYGENYGAAEETIWPHEWAFSSATGSSLTLDGVIVDTYACSCELRGTQGTSLDGIGAACHEFSHCLGLPDFYDTSAMGSNFGMGSWDVMDSGSYNDNSCTPAGYSSYERMFAGWLTPTELNMMTRVSDMKPLADTPEAYILYNDANRDEYYLLENRQKKGFDTGLPGHGLLVLHVDYDETSWQMNEVNQGGRQRMTIIPADNAANYSSYSGDPFPGSRNVTELTNYSTPAALLYNENVDGRKLLSKPLDHITESEDGLIAFVACRPEMEIPVFSEEVKTEGNSFTVSWGAVADAVEYELELTETPASKHNLEECLMVEEPFDKCYSKSTGFSDLSTKIVNYVNSGGWTGSKLFTSPNGLLLGTSQATGYIVGPTFDTPASGEITVVIGGKPYGQDASAKGSLRFITTDTDDRIPFELTADKRLVFHLETRYPRFRVGVYPESRMYLNYYAVYEGIFTEEELAVKEQAQARPQRINALTYNTDQTYYTFKDLNTTSRYNYRIRAIGEETISQWGEEQEFRFDSSVGISPVEMSGSEVMGRIYDLQGRQVNPAILRKGVYIVDGKKVVR